jgi:hypothetical protein
VAHCLRKGPGQVPNYRDQLCVNIFLYIRLN